MGKKKNVVLPPQLPPDIAEEEVEVSDEDLQFVKENRDYAGFVNTLDTQSITRHVSRRADQKANDLEYLYEQRIKKKSLEKSIDENKLEVDPVDALPVKTLDGKIYYRTVPKESRTSDAPKEDESVKDNEDDDADKSTVKLTKSERRTKLKKSKKEAKKQAKEPAQIEEEVQENPQAEVLAEVKEDLTAEEVFAGKKSKLAEYSFALLADPASNMKFLNEMLQICKDEDHNIVKDGLLSLMLVYKDIIPGYRIRLPTEKELEMTVSKEVQKMRRYESTLLSEYKAYLQKLVTLEKQRLVKHAAVFCMCHLVDAVPHFNFRESLLAAVIKNISSPDDFIRKLCCKTVKSLFADEGKHGGEATVEAVQLIADYVRTRACQLHPDSIEVFLSLSVDENVGRSELLEKDKKVSNKRKNGSKNSEDPKQLQAREKKKSRKELLENTRKEVNADFKATSFTPDVMERRSMQSETLSAVFQTYFRILKHAMQPAATRSKVNTSLLYGAFGAYPLLSPCLNGLGKFSHLIDLDFMGDLMTSLKTLACGGSNSDGSPGNCLTVSERLRCCIVAFKVMRNNLDALNVDLQDFFAQFYNLLLEYRPDREDRGEVLAEALKMMLCDVRQHDMQRAAAFVKRLATFSLCVGTAESMAALVTLYHLLLKNAKCRNLLENDAGGGSVSGSVLKYHPYVLDPNLSGALSSVLWELSLLSKHYHPAVKEMASSILSMSTAHNQIHLSIKSPPEAFGEYSLERESFTPKSKLGTLNRKRKKGSESSKPSSNWSTTDMVNPGDEEEVKKRFSEHFMLLRDITENERLRGELNHTMSSIQLYEEYKRQKKRKQGDPKTRKKGKSKFSVQSS